MKFLPKTGLWAFILFLFYSVPLFSSNLKTVLIMDFVNIEKNLDFEFVRESITSTVKKMLKDKFVFRETAKSQLDEIADVNYIFPEDFFTKTAAINLGLLGKQDVVISGAYKILKGTDDKIKIVTFVRIFNISQKKIISEFSIEGAGDDRLWDSINRVAERIAFEIEKILPNREEWKRQGLIADEGLPYINNIIMGIRLGGGYFSQGYADRINAEPPVISFVFKGSLPALSQYLALQLETTYLRQSPDYSNNPNLERLRINTSNYFIGGYLVLDFYINKFFSLHPKIGGGYVIQYIQVTGYEKNNFTNTFPYFGGGLELSYRINSVTAAVIGVQNYSEYENGTITMLNTLSMGVQFKL